MPWRKPVSKEGMNSRGGSKRDFERERCWRGEKRAEEEEEEEVGSGWSEEVKREESGVDGERGSGEAEMGGLADLIPRVKVFCINME